MIRNKIEKYISEMDESQQGRYFGGSILFLWFIAVFFLFFRKGSGEHDTFMMAAGIVKGVQTGATINPFNYGQDLQFLFYYLMKPVAGLLGLDTGGVLVIMNIMGAACSLAIAFLLNNLLQRYLPTKDHSYLATALVVTSPVYFFTVSYGHPFHMALVCSLLSLNLFYRSFEMGPQRRWAGWLFYAASLLMQSAAIMIRFEQVVLFWCVVMGLIAFRGENLLKEWMTVGILFALSLIAFFIVKSILVPSLPSDPLVQEQGVLQNVALLMRTFDIQLLKWSVPHWLAEIGIPLILLSGWFATVCIRERKWTLMLGAAAALLPSFILYLGNPSPPRHLYIAAIGLSAFIGQCIGRKRFLQTMGIATLVLLINLVFPWMLMLFDGKTYPDRSNVSYNVIQRTFRNKAQIQKGSEFYTKLISNAHKPTLVFGNWIHVAQIFSIVANDPAVRWERVVLRGKTRAHHLYSTNLDLYLVESYDPKYATDVIKETKTSGDNFSFLSLLNKNESINDLDLKIPDEIYWWNS